MENTNEWISTADNDDYLRIDPSTKIEVTYAYGGNIKGPARFWVCIEGFDPRIVAYRILKD
jgi:hypothetical protein